MTDPELTPIPFTVKDSKTLAKLRGQVSLLIGLNLFETIIIMLVSVFHK